MNDAVLTRICIVYDMENIILGYAAKELERFLNDIGFELIDLSCKWEENGHFDRVIRFFVDSNLPETSYTIKSGKENNIPVTLLTGHGEPEVLHAVYSMLEMAGISFEITGPIITKNTNELVWESMDRHILPAIKYRGVRQHINFPMDISSYPLEDAKEYIRNLARMKLNYIVFHSYPGQWFECRLMGKEILAGDFFYGQRHDIPEDHFIKDCINNDRVYCIPELESVYDEPEQRSKAAIDWLREVMLEAKNVGMRVQLSIESRDESVEGCIRIFKDIITQYPIIDTFELITQECGTWAYPVLPKEKLEEIIVKLFGSEILEDGRISRILDHALSLANDKSFIKAGIWQLPGTLKELSTNIRVFHELKKHKCKYKLPGLSLGIYATDHSTLKIAEIILKKYCPDGVSLSFLPAHGARAVVDSLNAMEMKPELLRKTMLHGWIEFDGNMYLQQNPVSGISLMFDFLNKKLKGEQAYGICLNHWRVAENKTAAKYSSIAFIDGYTSPDDFYKEYAKRMEIKGCDAYSSAMNLLDETDNEVRNRLSNIGFCFSGCWWSKGLGYFGAYDPDAIAEIKSKYAMVNCLFGKCLNSTENKAGIQYLEFIINRIECTLLHLETVKIMTRLQGICGNLEPDSLDEVQRYEIKNIIRKAIQFTEKYMCCHLKRMPDRSCQGTLISYYHTIPAVINSVKNFYTDGDVGIININKGADVPPPPAI